MDGWRVNVLASGREQTFIVKIHIVGMASIPVVTAAIFTSYWDVVVWYLRKAKLSVTPGGQFSLY